MPRTFLTRLLRNFACPPVLSSVRTSAAPRFRPQLESLGERVVPAAFYWTGAQGSAATNPFNWSRPPGVMNPPTSVDDVYFNSGSVNCIGLGGAVASLHILSGYSGTVTLGGSLTVGAYEQTGAALAQSNSTNLTVNNTFTWTGGILNSTPSTATVSLRGATGTVNPGIGNTLTTGSTLSLESRMVGSTPVGASITFREGTINFAGSAGVVIDQFCFADVKALQADVVFQGLGAPWIEDDSQIELKTGATVTVTGPGSWDGRNKQLRNQGGTLELKGGANASFGPAPDPLLQGAYGIIQNGGTTKLHTGSTLTARLAGMRITGGAIHIIADSPDGNTDPATLSGNLSFVGGAITFEGAYRTFKVVGDVTWSGGIFGPRLDVSQNGVTDVWEITGKLTIPNNSTAQVLPNTLNWNQATGIPANWRWESLKFGSVQLPANNSLPTVGTVTGNAPMIFFPTVDGDGKAHWFLGPKPN